LVSLRRAQRLIELRPGHLVMIFACVAAGQPDLDCCSIRA
jgi:hypothetical protein